MCRGCKIKIEGKPATYQYLDLLYRYQSIINDMKDYNKSILLFTKKIKNKKQHRIIDQYRKQLIKIQKEYAKADRILNELNNED